MKYTIINLVFQRKTKQFCILHLCIIENSLKHSCYSSAFQAFNSFLQSSLMSFLLCMSIAFCITS